MEHNGLEEMPTLVFVRSLVRISALTPITLHTECFNGFRQSLHANSGIAPLLDYNHFLPDPFLFIIHLVSSYHPTLYSIDTENASLNNPPKRKSKRVIIAHFRAPRYLALLSLRTHKLLFPPCLYC
jgi:hypothetical protein